MTLSTVVERLERLDVDSLDAGGVSAAVRELQRVKGSVADLEHRLARRADALAEVGAGAPASDVLGHGGNVSPREAARVARRADTLGELPTMSTQLGKGRIGVEHADAVTVVANRLDDDRRASLLALDDELAVVAASSTPARFRRHLDRVADQLAHDRGDERSLRQREATSLTKGINHESGMYWLRGEFDPETGARLFRAIDAETRAVAARARDEATISDDPPPRTRLAARALVELATSASRAKRPGRAELLALVDHDTLQHGLHDASTCELDDGTQLPVETIRRLACDADIIPVVMSGDSVPLDMGRSRRLATPDQRRALRTMYDTCGIGDCDVPFDDCEIHHLDHWDAHHGHTDLDRLLPGCQRHHHAVHEGGWQLHLDPTTRELTVTLPDGTVHSRSRPRSVTAPTVGRVA